MNFWFCRYRASVAWDGWRNVLLIDFGGKATCLNTIKRLSHHTFCVVATHSHSERVDFWRSVTLASTSDAKGYPCASFRHMGFSTRYNVGLPPRQYMKLWAFIPLANGRADGCTQKRYEHSSYLLTEDLVLLFSTQGVFPSLQCNPSTAIYEAKSIHPIG